MKNKIPKKPETLDEQVSTLWDAIYNGVLHRLSWQDIKMNFILAFLAIVMMLLGFLSIAFMVGR